MDQPGAALGAPLRLFTKRGCPHCEQAAQWLREQGCPFEVLEITQSVDVLREWRALSGGVGVPVLAHGRDIVIGFSPVRYRDLLDCRGRTTPLTPDMTEGEVRRNTTNDA